MNYDELVEQQGWNDETMLGLALQFIKDRGLWEAFESTLELQAIEENEIAAAEDVMLENEDDEIEYP